FLIERERVCRLVCNGSRDPEFVVVDVEAQRPAVLSAGERQFAGLRESAGHPIHHIAARSPCRAVILTEGNDLAQQAPVQRYVEACALLDTNAKEGVQQQRRDEGDDEGRTREGTQ